MQFSKPRAAMNVWLGGIAAAFKVYTGFPEAMPFPKTREKYVLTGEGHLTWTGHNYLGYERELSQEILAGYRTGLDVH